MSELTSREYQWVQPHPWTTATTKPAFGSFGVGFTTPHPSPSVSFGKTTATQPAFEQALQQQARRTYYGSTKQYNTYIQ